MLSIEQKYNICLMAEKHPKWTQLDLAKWALDMFQLDKKPSQGTVSRLLAKKDIYMNAKKHEKHANRLRRQNNLLVRRILQEWLYQTIWNDMPITTHILQVTSQSIWLNIPSCYREGNGMFSYRYITNFLSKLNLNSLMLESGHKLKPKNVWRFEERHSVKKILDNFANEDIFTVDETFLAYNLPLDYEQYESSEIQDRIEVVTVMLCSNLLGSEKLKPLVIGKYDNYSSFKNYFPDSSATNSTGAIAVKNDGSSSSHLHLGKKMSKMFNISYRSNSKLILTSNIFHDWLVRWDKRLVSDNRKVCLVLDDSCSHRIINSQLTNITLIYTSARTKFLPFNWGVLDEFKIRYRIKQYKASIDLQQRMRKKSSRRPLINFELSELTMSNAFKFIEQVWQEIPTETIQGSWRCSGIISSSKLYSDKNTGASFKRNTEIDNQLALNCEQYDCIKKWDYEMLLDLNIENKYRNLLSSNEIIESAIVYEFEPGFHLYRASNNKNKFEKLNDLKISKSDRAKLSKGGSNDLTNTNKELNYASNITPLYSKSETSLTNLKSVPVKTSDNKYNSGTDNYFELEQFLDQTTNNFDNNLFNVSTLIDNPDLFIVPELELQYQQANSNSTANIETFPTNIFPCVPINEINQKILGQESPQIVPDTASSSKITSIGNTSVTKIMNNDFTPNEGLGQITNIIEANINPNESNANLFSSEPQTIPENQKIINALEFILDNAENGRNIMFSDQSMTEIRSNISYLKNKVVKSVDWKPMRKDDNYLQGILGNQIDINQLEESNLNINFSQNF